MVSIGYERRSVEDLVDILVEHRVEKLLDVREAPISRRPGFSKRALGVRLDEAGIEYLHLPNAGNPHRQLRADVELCLNLYRSHLCENPQVLDAVMGELSPGTVAMLCYERDHDCCHRSVLLDALRQRGHLVDVVRVE